MPECTAGLSRKSQENKKKSVFTRAPMRQPKRKKGTPQALIILTVAESTLEIWYPAY
jgi:hypothetical protein